MKNDLELLIEHLVNEKKNLQNEIDKCLGMGDYTSAQFYFDALVSLNSQLKIFRVWKPNNPFLILNYL